MCTYVLTRRNRGTRFALSQVLLPSGAGGNSVPDWVYQRTPAELKEALLAARRKQEQSEVSWPEVLAISAITR